MKVEEIYHAIGQSIVDSIEEDWGYALLKIKFTGASVGFNLNYWTENESAKKSVSLINSHELYDSVEELHQITTEGDHNKWNRIKFKLTADGDMELEFIWDQELFDELERLSEE